MLIVPGEATPMRQVASATPPFRITFLHLGASVRILRFEPQGSRVSASIAIRACERGKTVLGPGGRGS